MPTIVPLSLVIPKTRSPDAVTLAALKVATANETAAVEFLDELSMLAHKEAKNTFTLPGLGKLVLVNRKARNGRNPQTGEAIKIPAKRVVKFRVAKAAKDAILGSRK